MKKKIQALFLVLIMLLLLIQVNAQIIAEPRQLQISKTTVSVKIDGVLEETEWKAAVLANDFLNKWPIDSGSAKMQTEVRIMFNDHFVYIGIRAFTETKKHVIQSLKRDDKSYSSEACWVVLDPTDKNISGYAFGLNAGGAQLDGILSNTGQLPSLDWDAKWYSNVKKSDSSWTAELAIPFNSIRYPSDRLQWGINFIRSDMTGNKISTWNRVPIQFNGFDLNYLGKVIFSEPLPKPKTNNVFIPYVTGRISDDQNYATETVNGGLDAKVALSTSLNMDLTINPDFSHVDVDRQIINLDRFSVLLPERRTFFLENSDLFAGPFFSRKIGLTDDGRVIPIIAGIRLTGNTNPATRIGLMNLQTAGKYGLPAQNYTVAAVNQKVLSRSFIRTIFINREAVGKSAKTENISKYNRVGGILAHYLSENTKFNCGFNYFHSFNPGSPDSANLIGAGAGFTTRKLFIDVGWGIINTNYVADLGFTPRLFNYDADRDTLIRIGVGRVGGIFEYFAYPHSRKVVNTISYFFRPNYYYNKGGNFSEFNATGGVKIIFARHGEAELYRRQNLIDIPFNTIIFSETGKLSEGSYGFGFYGLNYLSNPLRPLSGNLKLESGSYYNGRRISLTAGIKYREQPWGVFSTDITYNKITLNYKTIYPVIISTSLEISFSQNLFLTTFLQYNTQIKNFNVNSRFQWRFMPMSDLNIVYTDNYLTKDFKNKNRSVVLKANIWLN